MGHQHRIITGRDPVPLEASANMKRPGEGRRMGLYGAAPPSTQLL